MRSQIGSPKVVRPVNFRRAPRGLHSVAKQAPFRIAFRVDSGSENGPKIDEISSFGALRFASAIRVGKSLISGGPQSWKSLVLQYSKQKQCFSWNEASSNWDDFGWFLTPKLFQNPLKVASKCYCFFDFVLEANFNDFVVQFGVLKSMKFWKNR